MLLSLLQFFFTVTGKNKAFLKVCALSCLIWGLSTFPYFCNLFVNHMLIKQLFQTRQRFKVRYCWTASALVELIEAKQMSKTLQSSGKVTLVAVNKSGSVSIREYFFYVKERVIIHNTLRPPPIHTHTSKQNQNQNKK